MSKSKPPLPLTPAVFHILLALFGKERHGYDIMQQGQTDSQGSVKMGPGTLYGSLDRMIEAGLVAKGNIQDPRRIYYRLTALGQTTLRAETERLSRVALVARRQLGRAGRHDAPCAAEGGPVGTPLRAAAGPLPACIPATASRGDAAKLRRSRRRGGVEGATLAAYRKGPDDEPHFALFRVTAWRIRDRCRCHVDIDLRYRVFLLRPDARPSGLAGLRRLSARHAVHVHRDACLRNAVKQLARLECWTRTSGCTKICGP